MSILYFVFTLIAVVTLGLGFILYFIPFGIWIWWLVSTIKRVAAGMKALGLGQPMGFYGGSSPSGTAAAAPAAIAASPPPAPVVSMPPEGWYADAERHGHTRWWNGAAWGIRDDEHSATTSATASAASDDANDAPAASGSPAVELEVSQSEALQEPAVAIAAVEASTEATPAAAPSSASETASAPAPARFCENCGAARSSAGRFCTACGHA